MRLVETVPLTRSSGISLPDSLRGRRVVHINSTSAGGGVAEMLGFLVPLFNAAGLQCHWAVLTAGPRFFKITKRIHNGLHGSIGDRGCLSETEHQHFQEVSSTNLEALDRLLGLGKGDIVIAHDPQTCGLLQGLRDRHVSVVWRCHIGSDVSSTYSDRAWEFLRPYLGPAQALVFTRRAYVPDWVHSSKVVIMAPSINPYSPKNQDMSPDQALGILYHVGILQGDGLHHRPRHYTRLDGTQAMVERHADILHAGPLPLAEQAMVVQVSRWDHLKDMKGVMRAFADHVLAAHPDAHLVLAGPTVHAVVDDPEAVEAYADTLDMWRTLPHFQRNRVQLVCLPMADLQENAAIVNALQRHATVVVQKSLCEGFSLTVSEALYKYKPVVASAVGGILDQITDRAQGLLLACPLDLAGCGHAINTLLDDPELRQALGARGHSRVQQEFLPTRHVLQYVDLFTKLVN